MPTPQSPPTASPSPAASAYGNGHLIAGKYLLDRVLGEGGMGSVWLAHNVDLDAPVAIKLIRADVAALEAASRLKREARVEAQLEHRAIVRVFDFGETEHGEPFIVMERLHGMSLADALDKKGRISATSAARVLLPIIDGLSAAHAKGIVHRDIKPENIFLARIPRHLQPKILDFGIAKLDRWDPNPSLTLQGSVIGSPSYMSPEQARGMSDVDHRADVWAVCAVLYEAVTGAPPFRGETYNSLLRSIVEDPVAPLTNAGGADADLWSRVLQKGFEKDRTARFQTMQELGEAVARFLVAHGVIDDVCGDSLVATWKLDDEAARPDQSGGAEDAEGTLELAAASSADASTSVAPGYAPTSTCGLATPSSAPFVAVARRAILLPALASLVMAIGAGALLVRGESTGTSTGAARSVEERRPAPAQPAELPAPQARPKPTVVPVPPAPSATAAHSLPTVTPAPEHLATARSAATMPRAKRHGWPTVAATSPSISRVPPEPSGAPALRAPGRDEWAHPLDLKVPYQ